jgi:hypothetical protein
MSIKNRLIGRIVFLPQRHGDTEKKRISHKDTETQRKKEKEKEREIIVKNLVPLCLHVRKIPLSL